MPLPTDPRFNGFYLLTGVTFISFASGFGVCLFDLETVDACLATADNWLDTFLGVGNHMLAWAYAIVRGAFIPS